MDMKTTAYHTVTKEGRYMNATWFLPKGWRGRLMGRKLNRWLSERRSWRLMRWRVLSRGDRRVYWLCYLLPS